ncbi:MAG: class I SAM-dependent methyltransferase [bacterium]|nr:class I SAM-dependent methyltransferase [bacterium]
MKRGRGISFWNKEYEKPEHLALSTEPARDLIKFLQWLYREQEHAIPMNHTSVLDIGCGNGRNLIYMAKEFKITGSGFDISQTAIAQAIQNAQGLALHFSIQSLAERLPSKDNSQDIVLDMMASHVLNKDERVALRKEILRVLRPGGFLFFKTFALEGDQNAKRMIAEHPAGEKNSYIHPTISALEHVYTENEILEFLEPDFIVHRIIKSHGHMKEGRAFKRRSMSVYAEKRT